MFDDTLPFDPETHAASSTMQRTVGAADCTFKVRDGRTVLDNLRQSGSFKVRIPKTPTADAPEAVLLNTAGGLTGGDALAFTGGVADGGDVVFTTQASERAYRSISGDARVSNRVSVGAGARLAWLPQETILFDGSRLARTFDVEMAADATLLAHESVVFGRTAMDETVRTGALNDRWRITRDGTLIHADALRLDGRIADGLHRTATLNGATAMATVLYVGADAATRIEDARKSLDGIDAADGIGAASAWSEKLVCRMAARDGAALRRIVMPLLIELNDRRALPRVWNI